MTLEILGIPLPAFEVTLWGKSAQRIEWERRIEARCGWNVLERVSPCMVLLTRYDAVLERDDALVLLEDNTSEREMVDTATSCRAWRAT